jgi:hypothetical protein
MVMGYRHDVDWIDAAATDLLLIDWLQCCKDLRRRWSNFRKTTQPWSSACPAHAVDGPERRGSERAPSWRAFMDGRVLRGPGTMAGS